MERDSGSVIENKSDWLLMIIPYSPGRTLPAMHCLLWLIDQSTQVLERINTKAFEFGQSRITYDRAQ